MIQDHQFDKGLRRAYTPDGTDHIRRQGSDIERETSSFEDLLTTVPPTPVSQVKKQPITNPDRTNTDPGYWEKVLESWGLGNLDTQTETDVEDSDED